ncbi:hypothetical protein MPTK1_7g18430 [Marchantia polymorpha subsp. ruderalis]|uniref:Uncharacterized protein n=2 Tax=Marchantia polymorpha TaxID=3197 RepID=A0AAF6C139_MARPO|nr:hypothetical protein MARPO_0165s0003 [Marchantia polymorpha]BBN17973.1 hypothetical protein Mp_7g18430 [Marchantia polymorpha subsp. ruderalis]|eukprot:PTQ28373.1 hypothetical protein MARPO_0165s0003 [Marchantia polymorpha]
MGTSMFGWVRERGRLLAGGEGRGREGNGGVGRMAGHRPLYSSSNWVETANISHVRKIMLNVCAGRTSLLSADRSKRGRRLFAAPSLPLVRMCRTCMQQLIQ